MWGGLDTLPWTFVSATLKLRLLGTILLPVEGE